MDGSSSSSSVRRRTKAHLPLVKCPDCMIRTVKVYTSNTAEHPDIDFYKCPNHQVNESGCNFWKWEKTYKRYLESIGMPTRYEGPVEGRCKAAVLESPAQVVGKDGKEGERNHGKDVREGDFTLRLIQAIDVLKDIRILLICILLVEIIGVITSML